jgi:hypothetical protein
MLLVVLAVVLEPASAMGVPDPAPTLRLDAGRWQLVRPFRYDEQRRFERGLHRGVDVIPRGGRVVAPVAGRVAFAGRIFGSGVVTVATRIDGHPATVTFTGVRDVRLVPGQRVDGGELLGRGSLVHVGMYDQRRRTRYLPVVVDAPREPPAAAATDPVPTRRPAGSTLSGLVASRLAAAIAGSTSGSGAMVAATRGRTRAPTVGSASASAASAVAVASMPSHAHGASAASAIASAGRATPSPGTAARAPIRSAARDTSSRDARVGQPLDQRRSDASSTTDRRVSAASALVVPRGERGRHAQGSTPRPSTGAMPARSGPGDLPHAARMHVGQRPPAGVAGSAAITGQQWPGRGMSNPTAIGVREGRLGAATIDVPTAVVSPPVVDSPRVGVAGRASSPRVGVAGHASSPFALLVVASSAAACWGVLRRRARRGRPDAEATDHSERSRTAWPPVPAPILPHVRRRRIRQGPQGLRARAPDSIAPRIDDPSRSSPASPAVESGTSDPIACRPAASRPEQA